MIEASASRNNAASNTPSVVRVTLARRLNALGRVVRWFMSAPGLESLCGASDELLVPVSHSGMVFSPTVARQTAAFLREGRFER